MVTPAREIVTPNPVFVRSSDSVMDAAMRMVELDVGSLPIWGEDNTVEGIITDCDIVIKVIAEAHDPRTVPVSEFVAHSVKDPPVGTLVEAVSVDK